MIRFLDKQRELPMMELLFDLMHDNMEEVAPTGLTREWEKTKWLAEVVPALKKEPRQIVLLYCKEELAGFCMYYVNGGVFMVEELQILQGFRSGGMIVELTRFFLRTVPEDTRYIQAYADRENAYSRKLLGRLGLRCINEDTDDTYLHFSGDFREIRMRLQKKAKV